MHPIANGGAEEARAGLTAHELDCALARAVAEAVGSQDGATRATLRRAAETLAAGIHPPMDRAPLERLLRAVAAVLAQDPAPVRP